MKLSEPQKRVLRTMLEWDCPVFVPYYGGAWFGGKAVYHERRQVRKTTVRVLQTKGLLEEAKKFVRWGARGFILTPKGRKKAKELEDAQED